jgi:hypothetical protein
MTIGDRSIGRYANEKNEPILEEASVVERSFVTYNNNRQTLAPPQQMEHQHSSIGNKDLEHSTFDNRGPIAGHNASNRINENLN